MKSYEVIVTDTDEHGTKLCRALFILGLCSHKSQLPVKMRGHEHRHGGGEDVGDGLGVEDAVQA